jgi:hypothetical protein
MIGPRRVDKDLILYGRGKLGKLAEEIFDELKISYTMMDKYDRYPPIGHGGKLVAICVATEPYYRVIAPLIKAGWTDIMPVWDIIEAYPEVGIHNGWFTGKTINEREEISAVIEGLHDFISQEHYMVFRMWHQHRAELRPICPIEPGESLPSTLADIRNRQKWWGPCDSWEGENRLETVHIHAEGNELKALSAFLPAMVKQRPKISVSCYHSRDGLWKIEKYLMDNLPDYTWTFRLTAYMGQGAYIYGCPKEEV